MNRDLELLSHYVSGNSEAAMTELIQRNAGLVYSTACRVLCGDTHAAQDVSQQVFIELARHARRLRSHPALAGWFYTTTRRLALYRLRTDHRRKRREQEAHTLNELSRENQPDENWGPLAFVLDDVMHELHEKDRAAVLMRYFQNKPFREVGASLGSNENAARMRVERALEKLRSLLAKRGVSVSAPALAAALGQHAIPAPPAWVLAGLHTGPILCATANRSLAVMAWLRWGMVSVATAAVTATTIAVIQHEAGNQLRIENETLRQQIEATQPPPANAAAAVPEPGQGAEQPVAELMRLRDEVGRLRQESRELAQLKAASPQHASDPMSGEVSALLARLNELKQKLDQRPDLKIPELQFLKPRDWLNVALDADLETDRGLRAAFGRLRSKAKENFVPMLQASLRKYTEANEGRTPTDLAQLKPFFDPPVEDTILNRYQLNSASAPDVKTVPQKFEDTIKIQGVAAAVRNGPGDAIIYSSSSEPELVTEKAAVDADFDSLVSVGLHTARVIGHGENTSSGTVLQSANFKAN